MLKERPFYKGHYALGPNECINVWEEYKHKGKTKYRIVGYLVSIRSAMDAALPSGNEPDLIFPPKDNETDVFQEEINRAYAQHKSRSAQMLDSLTNSDGWIGPNNKGPIPIADPSIIYTPSEDYEMIGKRPRWHLGPDPILVRIERGVPK